MFTSPTEFLEFKGQKVYPVSLEGLAVIKRSHLWRTVGFDKHIAMYHQHLSSFIHCLDLQQRSYLKDRTAATMKAFPQGGPNLNQSVQDFFNDAVEKVYEHDYLHQLVAYQDKPWYTKMQDDPEKAWCNVDKWNDFFFHDKVECVAEEVQVIAIERFLVPSDWKMPYKMAYMRALHKVCTTLCKGWFRDFAIDNYPDIIMCFSRSRLEGIKQILVN